MKILFSIYALQSQTWMGLERRGERRVERRGECLIEIYHYTVICVIYCAAIEQHQHEFGSRPCTHTHTHTHTHAVPPVGQ